MLNLNTMSPAEFTRVLRIILGVPAGRKIRGEVKLFGAEHKGALKPYGKVDPNMSLLTLAYAYVGNPNHGDFYLFNGTVLGSRGRGAGKRPGYMMMMAYSRKQVLKGLDKYRDGNDTCLDTANGGIAGISDAYLKIRQTFGEPIFEVKTGLKNAGEIQPDPGVTVAPYARAWEKICSDLIENARWCGGLNNVQVDLTINEDDD